MSELIKINSGTIGGETIQTVNARDIHAFLEVGKDFSSWIRGRVEQFGFVDGQDFTVITAHPNGGTAGNRGVTKEYHITIDMAKELSMVERNEKGKQARQYFIECEHQAKAAMPAIPKTYAEALQLAADQAKQLEEQKLLIEDMSPKADFFDAVTDSKTAVDMAVVAKTLNMGIGRNQLFEFLRDKGILDRRNMPYQQYCDRGLFRVVESQFTKPDGTACVNFKTVVFQKGMDYIRRKLTEGGISK